MQTHIDNPPTNTGGEQGILEAAEILFAEKGFAAVSMSAIAKLANTSKPNIYHHFKNKNELYFAIMEAAVQRATDLLDALEDSPGTIRQRLAEFSAGQLENILLHDRSTQLILREAFSGNSERGMDIAKQMVGKVFSRLVSMVQKGQTKGEFRADIDTSLAAFMIVSTNMFYFQSKAIMENNPEITFSGDSATFNRFVTDIIFNGLIKPGKAPS
jgi:TetR/AcrR family transcriptional regulator